MKDDSALARNETALTISCGVPTRLTGLEAINFPAGPSISWRPAPVDMTPGLTELTLPPMRPHAFAEACTRNIFPRFDIPYARAGP